MLPPDSQLESRLLDARNCFTRGQFSEAIQRIEDVVTAAENQPRTLLQCAQAFAYCYEMDQAEALLDRLLAAVPTTFHATVATVFQQISRPDRAASILAELRDAGKLTPPNLAQLAKVYEQSNRRAEAIDALTECLVHAPLQPQPKVLLARLYRQSANHGDAERLLSSVVSSAAPEATLVHAWSELSLLRDQQSDYDQAIVAIENAKSLLREMPAVQQQARRSEAINRAFQRLYGRVEANTLREWRDETLEPMRLASVSHLIGFPRSGTTLLEQMLDAHSDIQTASERTVFSKAVFPAMCQQNGLSIASLKRCPRDRLNELRHRYVGWHESIAWQGLTDVHFVDKNPNHTSLLIGLLRLLPESKVVFALRDPRDVIVSTYMRFFSLSEFSASYLTWESTCELYAHELNVWLKLRSLLADNWIEVKYEDTVERPKQITKHVCKLMGVAWREEMLNYRGDANKFVHSPTHAEVREPLYTSSIRRWEHYKQHIEPYLDRLMPFVKAFGYD